MASPSRSAVGDHLRSRTEPPGCTTAVTPAAAGRFDAVGEGEEGVGGHHRAFGPLSRPVRAARPTELTRLIWPAPTPTVAAPLTKTMALDLTCLATLPGEIQPSHVLRGWGLGDHLGTGGRSSS